MANKKLYLSDHLCMDYRCRVVYEQKEVEESEELQEHFRRHRSPIELELRNWDLDSGELADQIPQFRGWTPSYILHTNGFQHEVKVVLDRDGVFDPDAVDDCSIDIKNTIRKLGKHGQYIIFRTYKLFPHWDIVSIWSVGKYNRRKAFYRDIIHNRYDDCLCGDGMADSGKSGADFRRRTF